MRDRVDGPETVAWKLVSAEEIYKSAKCSRTLRAKFPPEELVPRGTDKRPSGFSVR